MKIFYYIFLIFQLITFLYISSVAAKNTSTTLNSTKIPILLFFPNSTNSPSLYFNDTIPTNITSLSSILTSKANSRAPISCYYDTDCWRYAGQSSRCYNGFCICDLGYVATPTVCQPLICTSDSACWSRWSGTRCWSLRCSCDYGYQLEQASQTCRYVYRPPNGGGAGQSYLIEIKMLFFILALMSYFLFK